MRSFSLFIESSKSAEEIVTVVRALTDYLHTFSQRIEEYIEMCPETLS